MFRKSVEKMSGVSQVKGEKIEGQELAGSLKKTFTKLSRHGVKKVK